MAYRRFNESGLAGTLNPFLFFRRRAWQQRRETNPLFILDNPKDVAAALFFITAKLDGELTTETKQALLNDYQKHLRMNAKEASATLQQTAFMLEQYPIVRNDLKKILNKDCVARFSGEQTRLMLEHLPVVAERDSDISDEQQQWIAEITKLLQTREGQMF